MPNGESSTVAFLGLGSNLGDRWSVLRRAVFAIDELAGVTVDFDDGVAALYETQAVGGPPDQPTYLNAALKVTTSQRPHELLAALHGVESSLGRVRRQRWEARVIDIDILLFGDRVLEDDLLSIPHPRMHERAFVLAPLSDIAAGVRHPVLDRTVDELRRTLDTTRGDECVVRIADADWPTRSAAPISERFA